jgi:hypothetical protein
MQNLNPRALKTTDRLVAAALADIVLVGWATLTDSIF